jgi:hypothetical protein
MWSLAIAAALACGTAAAADAWKPANGPLMTRWAKDVSPDRVHPEYPRPQMVRKDWMNLNGLWELAFAKEGEAAPVGQRLSEKILVPFPVESALSGVRKHADRLWYRRTFEVPKGWDGRRVLLHFGAVDWEARVWLNGKELGTHRGGYDGFGFDITDALKPSGEQELIVGVWDPTDRGTQPRGKQVLRPQGIYYTTTTGIWQTVWLEPVPAASLGTPKITTDMESAQILVPVEGSKKAGAYTVRLTVKDGGRDVAGAEGPAGKPIRISVDRPKPWSPDSPFLYGLHVELRQGETVIDAAECYFGLRKAEVGKDEHGITRLLLNGKFLFQVGPLDQGFWPDGLYAAPTDAALKYDIEFTKQLGFNMARKHVKVEPERWYYWCDKLGLLVWQDMPSGDKSVRVGRPDLVRSPESAKQYEFELRRMIDGRFNHPSIIMWVVFNEGWGQFDTARITQETKRYDPSRLVNCASGWNDFKGVGDVHDIHVYPGPGAPQPEAARAAVLGEFGGLGLGVDGHTWAKKTWGYRGTSSKEDLTRKYERLLRGVWKFKDEPGLSAAVYTQATDVETEANGLMTYDRAVIKVDAERVAAANRGDFSRVPQTRVVVPTSQAQPQTWRYMFEKPADGWSKPGFDDASWKEGPGGFGTEGTPGTKVRTEWKTPDVWLRREITLPEGTLGELLLYLHHDEDAEVYLNGVLAAKVGGYVSDYEEVPISAEGKAALKPGKNLIAVHCHQTRGGQYIDVGLVEVKKPQQ